MCQECEDHRMIAMQTLLRIAMDNQRMVAERQRAIDAKSGQTIEALVPPSAATLFFDSMAIPKDAPHPKNAHLFIDYILRPEVSAQISAEFPYTNPNSEARKLLTPEQLANPASYPTDKRKLDTFRNLGKASVLIDELTTDLKNAQ